MTFLHSLFHNVNNCLQYIVYSFKLFTFQNHDIFTSRVEFPYKHATKRRHSRINCPTYNLYYWSPFIYCNYAHQRQWTLWLVFATLDIYQLENSSKPLKSTLMSVNLPSLKSDVLSVWRYSSRKLRKYTEVCMQCGKFVPPTIAKTYVFKISRDFEMLYLRYFSTNRFQTSQHLLILGWFSQLVDGFIFPDVSMNKVWKKEKLETSVTRQAIAARP